MGMFEYVAVLTSIIVGLGITHLLQGTARLIQHPEQGRPYWVHLVWVFYMFMLAVFWWWWEFRLELLDVWTFQVYLFVIFYAVTVYLLCAMLFPQTLDGYDGFKGYFYSRRAWFFGLFIVLQFIDVADTLLKGEEYFAGLGPEYMVVKGIRITFALIAIRTTNAPFHAVFAIGNLLHQLSWAVRMYETVG